MSKSASRTDLLLIIASWPEDAPHGAVARFCRENQVSREFFYSNRRRLKIEGLPQGLVPQSKRPKVSPLAVAVPVEKLALGVRARLKVEGWDYGPISVKHELERLGIASPSRATLARIFTRNGVVSPEPKKRPKSSYTRFRYPAPNECWQIDATDWRLADGTIAAIFQVTDDHSRLIIASLAARSENSVDAIRVVMSGIQRHGIPQRVLSDNGTALNVSRRGRRGELTTLLLGLGIQPISSSVGHPQTQGKNERTHSTLKRWLRAQPPAADLNELQTLLDRYDEHFNTHRPHQALEMMTPAACFAATPTAAEPTPPPTPPMAPPVMKQLTRIAAANGVIRVARSRIMLGKEHAGKKFVILLESDTITIFDNQGTLFLTTPRPPAGTFIPNGKPRGFMAHQKMSDPTET